MRIFVTGGSGFIGASFIKQAIRSGHEVLSLEKPSCLESFSIEAVRSFAPDAVMHCAWITSPSSYENSPYNIILKELSLKFFNSMIDNNVKQFICCGTCAEYKQSNMLLYEDESIIEPQSLYAKAKADLYKEMIISQKKSDTKITWARIFFPYGPGEHPDRLISSIIKAIQLRQKMQLRSPHAIRDYIHVEDVATALLCLCEKKVNGIFNIGTGIGTSLSNIQKNIEILMNTRNGQKQIIADMLSKDNNTDDKIVASVKKISALGWKHRYSINSGLETYMQSKKLNL